MPEVSADVLAARAKLAECGTSVRTGGKGTARRTKLSKHVNNGADDKQLQAQLKRLGVNNIPGIEEVNMFKEDGEVLHFASPKVQASVGANTYVISGHAENKKLEDELKTSRNDLQRRFGLVDECPTATASYDEVPFSIILLRLGANKAKSSRKPAQVEAAVLTPVFWAGAGTSLREGEMLKRAAAASCEAPNRAMKRRIRQRLHKKLGLMVSGNDFDKAIERFHLLEASKEGQVCQVQDDGDDGRFAWEGAWPLCAVQDVKPLEEKAIVRVEGMESFTHCDV
ncbi:unnamed protein product, partial [Cladocopium goreaui]